MNFPWIWNCVKWEHEAWHLQQGSWSTLFPYLGFEEDLLPECAPSSCCSTFTCERHMPCCFLLPSWGTNTHLSPKTCIHKLLCCQDLKPASTTKLCPLKEAYFYVGSHMIASILHLYWLVTNQAGHCPLPICDQLPLNWWSLENLARGSKKVASRVCWTWVAMWDLRHLEETSHAKSLWRDFCG